MTPKIRSAQVGYTSEWALAKLFSALQESQVKEQFELSYLCGREGSESEAFIRLENMIKKGLKNPHGNWRGSQRMAEIESTIELMESFYLKKARYVPINGDQTLPKEVYQNSDAIIIFSRNTSHLGYLSDALNHQKHILCEKPLVTLLDERGRPDDAQLKELEIILQDANPKLTVMDSEHYSYKKASLMFYEHQENILRGRKIKRVEGCLKEIDDPEHARTKALLSPSNGTGLLLDTGVHLQTFITYLGGEIEVEKSEYGIYPGYFVDTYDKVKFHITGESFTKDARGEFVVAKFIDRLNPAEREESKYLKLFLKDDTEIEINFKDNKVIERNPKQGEVDYSFFRYPLHKNEYVNILGHFYESIQLQKKPLTDARNSLKTLQVLYQMYTHNRKEIQPYGIQPSPTPPTLTPSPSASSAAIRGGLK